MKKIVTSLTSAFLSCVVALNTTYYLSSHAAYTRRLPAYPIYTQVGNNCWAYAILSMSNYMYGGYSINDIYNAYENATGETYNYNGATVNEAHDVMNYIFSDYNPVKKDQLTSDEIKLEINSDFPVYIRGDGHAVALMGYRSSDASSSVVVIYYMNSATGSIMYSGYAEGTENTFYTNASQVYNWENSIIIAG